MSTERHILTAADVGDPPNPIVGDRWLLVWHEMERLGWGAGTVLSHDFLCRVLGLPDWSEVRELVALKRTLDFALIDLRSHMRENRSIEFKPARDEAGCSIGLEVMTADEQVQIAPEKHIQAYRRANAKLRLSLTCVRIDELTDEGTESLDRGLEYVTKMSALFTQANTLAETTLRRLPRDVEPDEETKDPNHGI